MTSNRLLVIDDEPANSATIGRIARGCGYDVIITTDVDDCRSRIMSWKPTVIVLDLAMPEMDGIQLMEWLAKHECQAQILIVSGKGPEMLQQAEASGRTLGLNMTGSLPKPLRLETLRAVFSEIYDAAGLLSILDISKALTNQEILLMYQPQVELRSGAVVGFEALARWNHPQRGSIPPDTFIPMMEVDEIVNDFTTQIVKMALADMCLWEGADAFNVAINVSAVNCGSMVMPDIVQAQCASKDIACQRITIEVTETAAMAEACHVSACLERLHRLGIQLSIDDFGTGYSSLVKLHQLPFSEVKIDKSFVLDCVSNPQSSVLVQAMIDLAHKMKKRVVAEGVENRETMQQLREWGCDIAQGYFISRPMLPRDVLPWLQQYDSGRSA
ncbi:MAG: EAL domain-containing response regulator [Acidobacteriaceae bacterium]|nr:EAL domain-containing response regulator [Acidobacteriaceae bacterium]